MATVHYPVNTLLVHRNASKTLIVQVPAENAVQICAIKSLALDHK